MNFKEHIRGNLRKILAPLGVVEMHLEHPLRQAQGELDHGDYSTNIAMAIFANSKNSEALRVKTLGFLRKESLYSSIHPRAKAHGFLEVGSKSQITNKLKKVPVKANNPREFAEYIAKKYRELDDSIIEKVEVAGGGFVNFWIAKKMLIDELNWVAESHRQDDNIGGQNDKQYMYMVEFAHPNTHKLFHIGHLRNIITGEAICRLLEATGRRVIRVNYQGDVGLHVAKALWGLSDVSSLVEKPLKVKMEALARAYVDGNKAYIGGQKSAIEEINKKLYAQDAEIYELYQETREWSLEYFDEIYSRFGTKFDRLYFESEVAERGLSIVKENLGGLFVKSEGAVIFPGEKFGLHNRVFINSLGLPTYEAKDVGLAYLQFEEYSPELILHVVASEQSEYFKVLFEVLSRLDNKFTGREKHLVYGWVRLKEGKMSSREGNVIAGMWVVDETKKKLRANYKMGDKTAEIVALASVKYSMLRIGTTSEVLFNIDESIRLDGESGPYIQYTYARCQSVLERAKYASSGSEKLDSSRILSNDRFQPEEVTLLRTIYKFPEVVEGAASNFAPNLVCNFLFELSQKYNAFYNKHRILGSKGKKGNRGSVGEDEARTFRLLLTQRVGEVLKTGLGLLGIDSPEKM